MARVLLLCFLGWLPSIAAPAQSDHSTATSILILQDGVATHAGIDAIYARFSAGYRALDAASVAGLYTETAAYLAPGQDAQIGRAQIEANFARFFGRAKQRGEALAISFRIVQRQAQDRIAYDVGIYTLTITAANGSSRQARGKFAAVATLAGDGAWRFQVDSYSDLE